MTRKKYADIEEEDIATDDTGVPDENSLLCLLTNEPKKDKEQERTLQSLIRMMDEEYGFNLTDIERDFTVTGEDESGKKWRRKVDLVVFEEGSKHEQENIIRLCIVMDGKVKETDAKKGTKATLEPALGAAGCEFGLWTNGNRSFFLQKKETALDQLFIDLADFPGAGETLDDLDRSDKTILRSPANDSLIRTFKRCHDYIYGNDGRHKDAFWQLLNLIFCKIYDEKQRFNTNPDAKSFRCRFWVGVKENNTLEGRAEVARRIKEIFEELKKDNLYKDVFPPGNAIELTDGTLAYCATELSRYSFLDATVDVKGMAYETIVSNTLKQERGQFFTPRNIVRLMVEMLDPEPYHRVLDPACGSGGFLVMVLDHVRRKIGKQLHPGAEGPWLDDACNQADVNAAVTAYAEQYLFGIDFDPDLKRAARMNMVMSGDGHANIFQFNSLEYMESANREDIEIFHRRLAASIEQSDDDGDYYHSHAEGKFDLIFTNPPFGAKIPITDKDVLAQYDLGHTWRKNDDSGQWVKGGVSSSQPPEILFIDRCYQFLKPGGRMAIVLPDGILGNPNTEYIRAWILRRFRVLASVDLPVEAFLPQVGVQASLLFLQKMTDLEQSVLREGMPDYEVFMAIAEKVGHDRRGVSIYERDEDGAEIITEKHTQYLFYDRKTGQKILKSRKEKTPTVDDDLPRIGQAYRAFKNRRP
jgi:type I restriction enzyme M protein